MEIIINYNLIFDALQTTYVIIVSLKMVVSYRSPLTFQTLTRRIDKHVY